MTLNRYFLHEATDEERLLREIIKADKFVKLRIFTYL